MIFFSSPSLTACWCTQESLERWEKFAGGSLEHICWWMASHPMHLDGAKSWTMRTITNIQTSQTRVYRDHSLELKAWEFLKEKVWSGSVHMSQELSKCLCSSQNLMRKLSSWAKHTVKMESRLLHSSVSWKNGMYVNVRKEKSLEVHFTSRRKHSKEWKTRTCRARVPWKSLTSAPESWLCRQSCRTTCIISQTIWVLSLYAVPADRQALSDITAPVSIASLLVVWQKSLLSSRDDKTERNVTPSATVVV